MESKALAASTSRRKGYATCAGAPGMRQEFLFTGGDLEEFVKCAEGNLLRHIAGRGVRGIIDVI